MYLCTYVSKPLSGITTVLTAVASPLFSKVAGTARAACMQLVTLHAGHYHEQNQFLPIYRNCSHV